MGYKSKFTSEQVEEKLGQVDQLSLKVTQLENRPSGGGGGGISSLEELKSLLQLQSGMKIMLYGDSIFSTNFPYLKEYLEAITGAEVYNGGFPGYTTAQLASSACLERALNYNPDIVVIMVGGNDVGSNYSVGTFGTMGGTLANEGKKDIPNIGEAYSGGSFIEAAAYIANYLTYNIGGFRHREYIKGNATDVGSQLSNESDLDDAKKPLVFMCTTLPQQRGNAADNYSLYTCNVRKADAIREVCKCCNIPLLDLAVDAGFARVNESYWLGESVAFNKGTYMTDGLHPNKYGYKRMANLIADFISKYYDNGIKLLSWLISSEGSGDDSGNTDLINISINGASSITDSGSYSVAYTPSNTAQKGVTWSIVSGSTFAEISSSGVLTAKEGASNSSVTIKATSTANPLISATKVVSVTKSVVETLESLTISVADNGDETMQASVAYTPNKAEYYGVTWSIVSGGEFASINSTSGLITITASGSVTIKATSTYNSAITATKVVEVTKTEQPSGGNFFDGKTIVNAYFYEGTKIMNSKNTSDGSINRYLTFDTTPFSDGVYQIETHSGFFVRPIGTTGEANMADEPTTCSGITRGNEYTSATTFTTTDIQNSMSGKTYWSLNIRKSNGTNISVSEIENAVTITKIG